MSKVIQKRANPESEAQNVAGARGGLAYAPPPVSTAVAVAPVQRQAEASPASGAEAPPAASPNNTGLPDNLKAGVESLSGYDLSDVNVHYNSRKPAQLQALAYTQGTDIHVGPGQEKHLPHEAWHMVQQKQERVKANTQFKGVGINDNHDLEKEATLKGEEATRTPGSNTVGQQALISSPVTQRLVVTSADIFENDQNAFKDTAVYTGTYEAYKAVGGPVCRHNNIPNDLGITDGILNIAIVGHGLAQATTGSVPIANIVDNIITKLASDPQIKQLRTIHLLLFTCVSASKYTTEGPFANQKSDELAAKPDAQTYLDLLESGLRTIDPLSDIKINIRALAPQGIGQVTASKDPDKGFIVSQNKYGVPMYQAEEKYNKMKGNKVKWTTIMNLNDSLESTLTDRQKAIVKSKRSLPTFDTFADILQGQGTERDKSAAISNHIQNVKAIANTNRLRDIYQDPAIIPDSLKNVPWPNETFDQFLKQDLTEARLRDLLPIYEKVIKEYSQYYIDYGDPNFEGSPNMNSNLISHINQVFIDIEKNIDKWGEIKSKNLNKIKEILNLMRAENNLSGTGRSKKWKGESKNQTKHEYFLHESYSNLPSFADLIKNKLTHKNQEANKDLDAKNVNRGKSNRVLWTAFGRTKKKETDYTADLLRELPSDF